MPVGVGFSDKIKAVPHTLAVVLAITWSNCHTRQPMRQLSDLKHLRHHK
nr:MAG TPA: hypothetical protein [Caudoviricetes sp.]